MRNYETIHLDYDQFPVPDLTADIHWIHLPTEVYRKRQEARREAYDVALEKERLTGLPDHKVILVPADPSYSPKEEELWPYINHAVQTCIAGFPDVRAKVHQAVRLAIAEHRGWRNPFPANIDIPDLPKPSK